MTEIPDKASPGETILCPFLLYGKTAWIVAEVESSGARLGFNPLVRSELREEALLFAESLGRKAVEFPFEIDILRLERDGSVVPFERSSFPERCVP